MKEKNKNTKSIFDKHGKLKSDFYEKELDKLQIELVKLQEWIKYKRLKVVVLFEGRDAAGKGGIINRITECMNPRICRVEALGTPTEKEKTQWYFQRYVAKLPAAGEMVLFDRSWYNRAGVEHVMGFCSKTQYWEFLRSCPNFEQMLIRSGITLIKFWLSVSPEEQEKRFQSRLNNPAKRWKLSEMDLKSRMLWNEYSKAKDNMFDYTDTKISPWFDVPSDDKKKARLNAIRHILNKISYKEIPYNEVILEPRNIDNSYERPPLEDNNFVRDYYEKNRHTDS